MKDPCDYGVDVLCFEAEAWGRRLWNPSSSGNGAVSPEIRDIDIAPTSDL
jgi:hypothetical protein